MSQTLEELMEKTDIMEYPKTLKYIQGPLAKSALRRFIQQLPMLGIPRPAPPPSSTADKWAPTGHDRSFYDTFKGLLQQQGDGGEVEVPKLNDLTKRLELQFEKVFGQIALTQRRGILHRSPLGLHGDCDEGVVDMAMRYEDTQEGSFGSIYIATRSIKSKHLCKYPRLLFFVSTDASSLHLPRGPGFRKRSQLNPEHIDRSSRPPRRRNPSTPVCRRRHPHDPLVSP